MNLRRNKICHQTEIKSLNNLTRKNNKSPRGSLTNSSNPEVSLIQTIIRLHAMFQMMDLMMFTVVAVLLDRDLNKEEMLVREVSIYNKIIQIKLETTTKIQWIILVEASKQIW